MRLAALSVIAVGAMVTFAVTTSCSDEDDRQVSPDGGAPNVPDEARWCTDAGCVRCPVLESDLQPHACKGGPSCTPNPEAGVACNGAYCDSCLASACRPADPCEILTLVGTWEGPRVKFNCPDSDGGPCGDTVTFRCDGTFEHRWEQTRFVGRYMCHAGNICVIDGELKDPEPTYAPGQNGFLHGNCLALQWGNEMLSVPWR